MFIAAAPPGRRHRACCGHKSPHRCGRSVSLPLWKPRMAASSPSIPSWIRSSLSPPARKSGRAHTRTRRAIAADQLGLCQRVAGGGQTAERLIRVRLCLGLHQIHILWLLYIINKTDGFVKKNFESICESLTEQENCPLSRTSTPSSFLSQGGDLVRQPLRRRLGRILIPGLHHDPHQGLSARGAHQHPALAGQLLLLRSHGIGQRPGWP